MIYQPKAALVAWWRQAYWMVPGLTTVVVAVAIAFLAPGVALASGQYVLAHPTREHCRRNYVRDTKTVRIKGRRVRQVWCIHHATQRAPNKAPAGSLEWLLAHTSVARISEVFAKEVAKAFAPFSEEDKGPEIAERKWTPATPSCNTGEKKVFQPAPAGDYYLGYIECRGTAELQYEVVSLHARLVRCTEQQENAHEDGCSGEEPWYSEPYTEPVKLETHKYLATLFVSQYNESEHLCANLGLYYYLGDQWESLMASGPACNVEV